MPLRRTQLWLQRAIIASGEPDSASEHVAPSATLTADERIAIYRDLYPARLVSALKADYRLLCQYLDGPVFTQLALIYASARPSQSFSLNQFGAKLPEFLGEVKGLPRPGFVRDLARFEQVCAEVFHAAEAPPLSAEAIAKVPAGAWERARLKPIPALRLLTLNYPVHVYAEGQTSVPRRQTHLVIYRTNYQVAWLPVAPQGARVLTALMEGRPLGIALEGTRGPVMRWFQSWMAAGWFQRVALR